MSIFLSGFLNTLGQQFNSIIPAPVEMKTLPGNFSIGKTTTIKFNTAQKELYAAAQFLKDHINSISGYNLEFNKPATTMLELKLGKINDIGNEGYLLSVTPSSINITANTKTGIVYGLQSLFQLLPAIRTNAALTVSCMNIKDYPRFKWRGMHLDVSRHFFGPEFVKKYIDLMSQYKFNTFHWHLTDDQGWRIEIKKYPLLTQIGAWRVDKNNITWSSRPQAQLGEQANYGGYYTQEQIKDIIKYAALRNITIVPEIEMPGHSAAAIASYPFLSCMQQAQLPMTGGNYTNISSNYCAGNDSAFTFLENVLTEVMNLFPSQYIHVGGDEVDKTSWKNCPKCQERMKKEGLKNEEELQSYFIKRIEKFISSKKRKMIGWDEILEGGLAPEATVMSWRGEAGGIEAAKMNHNVVMTPGTPLYFDHYQADPATEPRAIGGFNTLKRVYDYNPIPKELDEQQSKFILGAQANLWAEFITTSKQVEYMVLPRMLALAEVLWSPQAAKDWNNFNERLQYHLKAFDQKGLNYSKGNFKVNINPSIQDGKLLVSLSTEAYKGQVYYTSDGTTPDLSSKKYTTPISIDSSVTIKAITVVDGKIMSAIPAQQSFILHKAIGKNVSYTNPVSPYYRANGPSSLTDGVRGTEEIGKYWQGFSEKDMIATVDLGQSESIHSLTLGCLQHYNDWIFLPQFVKFETSENGVDFEEVKTIINPIDMNQKTALYDFKATFAQRNVRYIRVTAKNNLCPPGHSGAGKPSWIFTDELIVQ